MQPSIRKTLISIIISKPINRISVLIYAVRFLRTAFFCLTAPVCCVTIAGRIFENDKELLYLMKKSLLCLIFTLLAAMVLVTGCSGGTAPSSESTAVSSSQAETDSSVSAETCTLSITCSALVDNLDKMEPDKAANVPSDGIILKDTSFSIKDGDTALDLLRRAAESSSITLDESSGYIRGIAGFQEFDCGDYSGWMYEVNGESPSVGCDQYTLQPGDQVEFLYICAEF